jgi:hypothetical protein
VAVTALATGYLASAYGLRPAPFLLGAAYIALGLGLSAVKVRETRAHARHEAASRDAVSGQPAEHLTTGQIARLTSFRERALSAASWAGMVNNLNDGLAWGAFPVQLGTGALSDRIGRKWLIAALTAAAGILVAARMYETRPGVPAGAGTSWSNQVGRQGVEP